MTYIPDPVEQMESRIDDACETQRGVPSGHFRCMECEEVFYGEPFPLTARPDSPLVCFRCLPEGSKAEWRAIEAAWRDLEAEGGAS